MTAAVEIDRAALRRLLHRIDIAESLRRRAVQEAISQATAEWWRMRAEHFQWARPHPADYPGGPVDWETGQPLSPPIQDVDGAARCAATAQACLSHATLLELEASGDD